MSTATIEIQPRVERVTFNEERLSVTIEDKRIISIPLEWYPRLLHATQTERENWRVFEDTEGRDIIFWEDLDELIPVVALLEGTPSRESRRSFEHWLAGRQS